MNEELFKYWDSDKAKKKQTALTRLSNGLAKELLGDRNRGFAPISAKSPM